MHIHLNETDLFSVVSSDIISFRSGDEIRLLFNYERIHMFDSKTGNRIEKAVALV